MLLRRTKPQFPSSPPSIQSCYGQAQAQAGDQAADAALSAVGVLSCGLGFLAVVFGFRLLRCQ